MWLLVCSLLLLGGCYEFSVVAKVFWVVDRLLCGF